MVLLEKLINFTCFDGLEGIQEHFFEQHKYETIKKLHQITKEKGGCAVLKDFIWGAFEKTGNIEYYMVYRQINESSSGQRNIPGINNAEKHEKSAVGNA